MCDELLGSLNKTTGLQRLIIHVHGIEENHPGTSNRAWETFTQQKYVKFTMLNTLSF